MEREEPQESTLFHAVVARSRHPEARANEALEILLRDEETRRIWLRHLAAETELDILAEDLRIVSEAGHSTESPGDDAAPSVPDAYPRPDFSLYLHDRLVATVETKVGAPFHGENQPRTYLELGGRAPLIVIVPTSRRDFFARDLRRLLGSPSGTDAPRTALVNGAEVQVRLLTWRCALSTRATGRGVRELRELAAAVEASTEAREIRSEFWCSATAAELSAFIDMTQAFVERAQPLLRERCIDAQRGRAMIWNTLDFTLNGREYWVGYILSRWRDGKSPSPIMVWDSKDDRLASALSLDAPIGTSILDHLIEQFREWLLKSVGDPVDGHAS